MERTELDISERFGVKLNYPGANPTAMKLNTDAPTNPKVGVLALAPGCRHRIVKESTNRGDVGADPNYRRNHQVQVLCREALGRRLLEAEG